MPSGYQQLFQSAQEDLQLENYEAASSKLRRLLEEYPDQPAIAENQLLLASCEERLGRYASARDLYKAALDTIEGTDQQVKTLLYLGTVQVRLEEYDGAVDTYNEGYLLEEDPSAKLEFRYRLGIALQRDGRFGPARDHLEAVSRETPDAGLANRARSRLALPDYFTVQVGAYGRSNAESQRRALADQGYRQATITPVPDSSLYAVRVGRYSMRADAVSLQKRLEADRVLPGSTKTKVVP